MELKYVILFLTSLCVVFIVVEEIFQFRLDTPTFVSSEKFHLVASKPVSGSMKKHAGEEVDFFGERQKATHQAVITMLNGEYYYDDVDLDRRAQLSDEDVTVTLQSHNSHGSEESLKESLKWKMNDNMSEEERLSLSPYIYHEEEELERLKIPIVEKEIKYMTYFMESNQHRNHLFHQCRYKKCATTSNTSKADLVVFAASTVRDKNILTFDRPLGQRWLMYTIDPSIKKGYNFDNDTVKSLFNATMTYNLDADIPLLFGRLRHVIARQSAYFGPIFDKKIKTAAWFVSHCQTLSKREVYVQRMLAVMNVDVYGSCGNFTCGGGPHLRSQDDTVCLPMLSRDYKFYLAFENSFCLDYITEKFFKLLQNVQIIPVVRGGFDYKRYLPSGTYINADDFETPEKLAEYLVDLGNDKQRYIEMLRRKDEWRLLKTPSKDCLLCEYLHSNPPHKFYPNLKEKFGRGSCWFPKVG